MFPSSLEELPPDWRAALRRRPLLWAGGDDPALVRLRDRDLSKQPADAWYMTFMWLFFSRDPQAYSESRFTFAMPENWSETIVPPAPYGQLPSLRAALAWRFAHFYHTEFNDPAVDAAVEEAFFAGHKAGPMGYLSGVSHMIGIAAARWRRYQAQSDLFPYFRFRCDAPDEADHSLAGLHGVILPVDHEFWHAAFPPNDVKHIGMIAQVSESAMRRNEWKVTDGLPENWRSLFPKGFDRNFAAAWSDVIQADLIRM